MWWVNLPAEPAEDTVARDMKLFGAQDFTLPAWMTEDVDTKDFLVLPENMEALRIFFACATQWHRGPKGEPTGLRYDAVEIVMKRRGVAKRSDAWWRVQVMELAALKEFAKQKA